MSPAIIEQRDGWGWYEESNTTTGDIGKPYVDADEHGAQIAISYTATGENTWTVKRYYADASTFELPYISKSIRIYNPHSGAITLHYATIGFEYNIRDIASPYYETKSIGAGEYFDLTIQGCITPSKTITGTVKTNLTGGSVPIYDELEGTGTSFLTELAVGDMIEIPIGDIVYARRIKEISSDTELTLEWNVISQITVATTINTPNYACLLLTSPTVETAPYSHLRVYPYNEAGY